MTQEEKIANVVNKLQQCLSRCEMSNTDMLVHCIRDEFERTQAYTLPDDPRIEDHIVSVTEDMYVIISGECGYCDKLTLHKTPLTQFNLLNKRSLHKFVDFGKNEKIIYKHIFNDFIYFTKTYDF
jgi:hypothetical protein